MPPRARRKPKPLPTVKRSTDPQVKRFVAARTKETRLVGRIDRMLVVEQREEEQQGHENYRGPGVLHPSEISKPDWCPRSSWWRIKLFREGVQPPPEIVSMRLEAIFQEGHEIHGKWQNWAWSTGTLAGMFDCLRCDHKWWGLSPSQCPNCDGGRKRLRYREVPVDGYDEFLIEGKADGLLQEPELPDSILEIKSMSQGTVRTEWKDGLVKNTKEFIDTEGREHKWIDLDQLWRDIKRPFPSHLIQGNLYGHIRGVDWVTYLYENKINQGHKEISVKVSELVWGPVLEKALDLKYLLEKDRPPDCSKSKNGCKHCKPYEEDSHASPTPARANGARGPRAIEAPAPPRPRLPRAPRPDEAEADSHHARRPAAVTGQLVVQSGGGAAPGGLDDAPGAVRKLARAPRRSDDVERQRLDAGDAVLHRVVRLPRRPALAG